MRCSTTSELCEADSGHLLGGCPLRFRAHSVDIPQNWPPDVHKLNAAISDASLKHPLPQLAPPALLSLRWAGPLLGASVGASEPSAPPQLDGRHRTTHRPTRGPDLPCPPLAHGGGCVSSSAKHVAKIMQAGPNARLFCDVSAGPPHVVQIWSVSANFGVLAEIAHEWS